MKKLIAVVLSTLLLFGLVACGGGGTTKEDSKTIKVGATPNPHQEILEFIKPKLKEKGYDLEIVSFTDYVLPNKAVDSKEIDANFFQHQPYLTDFNEKNKTDIVSAGSIHFEPLGIYPGKSNDLVNIPNGATIAIPNDTSNEARALNLLAAQNLIKLKDGVGLKATPKDVVENPHNIKFQELEAANISRAIADVDFAVLNGNYALQAGIIDKVLKSEESSSEAAQEFANIIAVLPANKDSEKIKVLVETLKSEEVRQFMKEKYGVAVVPVF